MRRRCGQTAASDQLHRLVVARRAAARLVMKAIETLFRELASPESGPQPRSHVHPRSRNGSCRRPQHDLGSHRTRPCNPSATTRISNSLRSLTVSMIIR
jgi:hypothetical protein